MSLWIDVSEVTRVLVGGQWFDVDPRSFDLDAFEFCSDDVMIHGAGEGGVCAKGFSFTSNGKRISGPLSAVKAVETKDSGQSKPKSPQTSR